jgi:molybdate transport system substrate-binding protein
MSRPLWPYRAGLVVLAALSAGRISAQETAAAEPELTVFAAASLAGAFQELGAIFEQAHPGTTVHFNFGGSQQLAVQLEHGAAADLFASADERWMSYAAERDLLAGAPRLFAHNRLVVIVPATNPARIGSLQHLARRGIKLVVAAEAVPVGAYSRVALAKLARAPGFPPDFDRKVLANVVSQEENVKAVVAKVQLGEADAGLVYASDAIGAVVRHLRVFPIPEPQNVRADYPLAVLRGAEAPVAAGAFVSLVFAPAGQGVLQRYGLIPAAVHSGMAASADAR